MFSYSLNSLIVFHEVVKLGSFSKAAETLFMTQPGVSNHIMQLEIQTGHKLINREKGGFTLTKEGKVIYKFAEKIEATAKELEKTIKAMKNQERPLLKIATTAVYSRVIMPFLLSSFQKAYPEIMIKLDLGSSDDMVKSVLTMENDVVIASNQKVSKKLYCLPFVREELVAITGSNHPLADREAISLSELAKYPLVIREEGSATRRVVLSALETQGIKPKNLIDVKSTEFIKEWVAQGRGVSILIKRAVQQEEERSLRVIPLKEPLYLEVSVIFLKSNKYDKVLQKFMEHIKELKAKSLL
ncbi:MAG: LysR family transcriptional regulator [Syntrophorhabdaceae bacterium]|nr:LysR family transcriptional regulator [Syntrophorhabdaceae bacterium]